LWKCLFYLRKNDVFNQTYIPNNRQNDLQNHIIGRLFGAKTMITGKGMICGNARFTYVILMFSIKNDPQMTPGTTPK
jgi:hypothetical protein